MMRAMPASSTDPWSGILLAALRAATACATASVATAACRRLLALLLLLLTLRLDIRTQVGTAEDLPAVNPDLNTERTVNRKGRSLGIVNVGTDRMQRHTSFEILLDGAHLSGTQTAGNLYAKATTPPAPGWRTHEL